MNSSIISIGNSKGIRIPKTLLLESGITNQVTISAKKGQITITAIVESPISESSSAKMSQQSLAKEWLNKAEDTAWKNL
ncbi:MAG: Transcriptional regulator/antitoxin, MazE [Patescibacteria group bacterium]|nr:Transcriptional regulator/antitoxin, MazE [Patescibacteria group bacterium]